MIQNVTGWVQNLPSVNLWVEERKRQTVTVNTDRESLPAQAGAAVTNAEDADREKSCKQHVHSDPWVAPPPPTSIGDAVLGSPELFVRNLLGARYSVFCPERYRAPARTKIRQSAGAFAD